MPKSPISNITQSTEEKIRNLYSVLIREYALLSDKIPVTANFTLSIKKGSYVYDKINKLIQTFNEEVYNLILENVSSSWDTAVTENNDFAKEVFGENFEKLPDTYKTRYLAPNIAARESFITRKTDGFRLSDIVWRNSQQVKVELELAMEMALYDGKSASTIATEIKKYLNNPDKLFRRVRDVHGELRLSEAAKAYNPGSGIYRSSYRNALRLARNEINFSYEKSNYEKRQQQDFVVGVQIQVSPSHNPADDKGGISCLKLQGFYPKDFDWTYKWHVSCTCISLSIIKTKEELEEDLSLILDGKNPSAESVNKVKEIPLNYKTYLEDNKAKWTNWKTLPRTFERNSGV